MKILYVCHFANSGWGYAAYDWIKAMHSVGMDVVVRNIPLNNSTPDVPELVKELESKSSKGCDVVIQNVLPHHMEYNGRLKNIGLYFYESNDLDRTLWARKLKLMDEVWCPYKELLDYTKLLTFKSVKLVPPASDIDKFNKERRELPLHPSVKDDFKFYTICDVNVRKNIKALIMAFHLAFRKNEPVSLVLKLNKFGLNSKQIFDNVTSDLNKIKHSMKLYPDVNDYKHEIIIAGDILEDNIYDIHHTCDCFVTTSHGEGWSIPTMDALGFGNPVLVPDGMSFRDYVPVPMRFATHKGKNFGMNDTFHELYSSRGDWLETDIDDLVEKMRDVYSTRKEDLEKLSSFFKNIPSIFSYQNVGDTIKFNIEEMFNREKVRF